MKNTILFQSAIKKITTRTDNTLDIVLNTQELPEEQMAQMFTLKNRHCAVAIAPHEEDIEPFDPQTIDAPRGKSPSQRLKAVIYLNWKQNNEGYGDSDQHYLVTMNRLIESFKDKLP